MWPILNYVPLGKEDVKAVLITKAMNLTFLMPNAEQQTTDFFG